MFSIISRIANQISSLPSNIINSLIEGYNNMYSPNNSNPSPELDKIIDHLKDSNNGDNTETEYETTSEYESESEYDTAEESEEEQQPNDKPISIHGENNNAPKESATIFDSILEISIEIAEYSPIGGGHHISLPDTMPK